MGIAEKLFRVAQVKWVYAVAITAYIAEKFLCTYVYQVQSTIFTADIAPNTAFKKHICLTFLFLGVVPGEKTGRKEEYLTICRVIVRHLV